MGLDRETLRQLQQLLRPLATKMRNAVARAVVQLVDDVRKLQMLQLGVLVDETIDDAEHHQPYGFSSVPLAGAEAVVVFPDGDRARPLVVSVSDRRHRPTGGGPGEVTVYNDKGAKIRMTKDGDIEITPAPGREVYIRDEGGTAERVVKVSEFNAHTHPVSTTGTASAQTGTASPPAAATGTQRLRVQ